jgi:crossover junction endodeoxyribonuclease RuvC
MRILGVDPGSLVTGYGVVDSGGRSLARVASGTIVMHATDAMPARLEQIYAELIAVIDANHPDAFCIETAFYGKNVQSTLKLGHVRGVAILAAMHRGLHVAEYSPREVKQTVTGSGAAAKHQVAYMVKQILGVEMEFRRSDEADGLALAICHALRGSGRSAATKKGPSSSWSDFIANNPERVRA